MEPIAAHVLPASLFVEEPPAPAVVVAAPPAPPIVAPPPRPMVAPPRPMLGYLLPPSIAGAPPIFVQNPVPFVDEPEPIARAATSAAAAPPKRARRVVCGAYATGGAFFWSIAGGAFFWSIGVHACAFRASNDKDAAMKARPMLRFTISAVEPQILIDPSPRAGRRSREREWSFDFR